MNTVKKLLAILLAAALAMGLAACGGSEPKQQKYTSEELYTKYLNNEYIATLNCNLYNAAQGEELTISDMIYGEADALKDYGEFFLNNVYISFIDCGLDGEEELLIAAEYITPGEYNDYIEEQFIVKAYDQELKVLSEDETFYRYETTIYNSGLIVYQGSGSAFEQYYRYEYMNPDGERVYLFSEDYTMGLAEAVIPYYDLPSDAIPDYEAYPEYAEADGISLSVYNFGQYEADDYDEEIYEEFIRGNMFVFYNVEGENCYPEEPYAAMYKNAGVKIYDTDTMMDMIDEMVAEKGVTDEIADALPAELTLLDSETIEWLPKG